MTKKCQLRANNLYIPLSITYATVPSTGGVSDPSRHTPAPNLRLNLNLPLTQGNSIDLSSQTTSSSANLTIPTSAAQTIQVPVSSANEQILTYSLENNVTPSSSQAETLNLDERLNNLQTLVHSQFQAEIQNHLRNFNADIQSQFQNFNTVFQNQVQLTNSKIEQQNNLQLKICLMN